MGRPIGNVVARVLRGFAVLADVGAKQGEVAGVARPTPVVDLTAEVADARRRRVDEAHVAQLELFDQVELDPAVEALELAARAATRCFAGFQRLLLELLEGPLAAEVVLGGSERSSYVARDVA